eukprot:TRINITY_DN3886_c0_g1_i1.p1 TRINITY_DN3886_c0_g1~~TRINITY_DN3886_c0_g1_i1.p1  ORF type:complete len:180 (+),score=46.70 TRINITY_DN3886_c0_g1_i1:12-551(+)
MTTQHPPSKAEKYDTMLEEMRSIVKGETDCIANMSNVASLVYNFLNNDLKREDGKQTTNWVGFYIVRAPGTLVLGPFHGKVACLRIKFGRGVCGAAASQKKTVVVPDVHKFEGHIACDSASESEIVVPLFNQEGDIVGVFDLDSPNLNQFDEEDKRGLEEIAKVLGEGCIWDVCQVKSP